MATSQPERTLNCSRTCGVPLTGGCLCGGVRYRLSDPPGALAYCHCSQCRKAQGVAFAANTPVAQASLQIIAGAALISSFRGSAAKTRYFCRRCGSPLYSHVDGADQVRLRAGTLDPGVPLTPAMHIFSTSAARWCPITDDLPRFPAREPGRR